MDDEILGKLERMGNVDMIAPFCFEICLKNGKSYFINSISNEHNQDPETFHCRVWDFRTFSDSEIEKANSLSSKELAKLDYANLTVYKKEITNIIDWHDKYGDETKISFWKRKSDEVKLGIFSGLIGFILGILSTSLL